MNCHRLPQFASIYLVLSGLLAVSACKTTDDAACELANCETGSTSSTSTTTTTTSQTTTTTTPTTATSPTVAAEPCPDIGLDATVATVHYVCDCGAGSSASCVPGDDANAGTTADAPWQSFEKARAEFGNLAAGDSIAFCRGGAHTVGSGSRWVNDSCLASEPCVVRDYSPVWAAPDEPRPIVSSAGQNVFALEDGGDANHEEGYTILNLDLRGNGNGQAFFIYNDIDDVLICNVSMDGFRIGVNVQGSNAPAAGSDGLNARIVLRNSQVLNNGGQGWLGGCEGCGIEYNTFVNNGFDLAVFNHNIYAGGPRDVRIVGNDLYQSALIDGRCQGVSLVVHGVVDGLLVENNTIHEDVGAADPGCWGIAIDTGYSSAESFRNVVIRGNIITNVGNVGIGLNACEDCVIENNVVIQDQAFGGTAIAVPDRDRDTIDLPMNRVTVRNNSVFVGAQSGGTGVRVEGEGAGHVVVSNAVFYAGNGGFSCLSMGLDTSAYDVADNNLCDAPEFTSTVAPYDLTPRSTSPLIDAGHPTMSAANDLLGRTRDASPDIGAYEAQP